MDTINGFMKLFGREKLLLVEAIMFAGRKGLEEFEKAIDNKLYAGGIDRCLSTEEIINVLKNVGMDDVSAVSTGIKIRNSAGWIP